METVTENQTLEDYSSLLKSGKLSDVTLSVGGRNFRAHKSILSARSIVFAAMFEHETKENQENMVEIPDIDSDVFEEFLQFIYTGKVIVLSCAENISKFC